MRSDRELIGLYQGGDEEAFREFYDRHRKPVFVYLLSLVRHRETAEELLQETFFAFLRHLGRLNGSTELRPFLLRTARNRAIDLLRRRKRGEEALEHRAMEQRAEAQLVQSRAGPPGGLEAQEEAEELSRLLHRLPDEQREAIVLKLFVEMTFREIGEITNSPESSVVSRYRYGLEKLRTFVCGGCDAGSGTTRQTP